MARKKELILDEIGYWSEIKLAIIREYAHAYSKILSAQKDPSFYHVYIDAFAGAGIHLSKTTGKEIEGTPLIAAKTEPPFKEYHFVDWDGTKVDNLRAIFRDRPDVTIHQGDCNEVLLKTILPQVRYEDYRRGLCLLDPYGLSLNWELIRTIGEMKSVDIFLNFPIADINRNVLLHNKAKVSDEDADRMNLFWGDESWRTSAYRKEKTLFDDEDVKEPNRIVAEAFRERLKKVAGFKEVPDPMPTRNSKSAIVYYLYFASKKSVAKDIVKAIFAKYQDKGA